MADTVVEQAAREEFAGSASEVVLALLAASPAAALAVDADGNSPLHLLASISGTTAHLPALQALAAVDGAALQTDRRQWTALTIASKVGNAPAVQALIAACPAALTAPTEHGHLPLHVAAAYDREEAAAILLAAAPEVASSQNRRGATPALFAAAALSCCACCCWRHLPRPLKQAPLAISRCTWQHVAATKPPASCCWLQLLMRSVCQTMRG